MINDFQQYAMIKMYLTKLGRDKLRVRGIRNQNAQRNNIRDKEMDIQTSNLPT